jgi:hypothetical protein
MAAFCLVAAQDITGGAGKGEIWNIREDNVFGSKEGLPNWLQVEISDATKVQVESYLEGWQIEYEFTVFNQDAEYWFVRVEVDPAYITASGKGKNELKSEMVVMLEQPDGPYFAIVDLIQVDKIEVRLPKSQFPVQQDLAPLKAQFNADFRFILELKRYYFDHALVDETVDSPYNGIRTVTTAQALNNLYDKITGELV